jgi:hypothetical protein
MLKRLRIRKRALILAVLAGVVALAVLATLPIVLGRTDPPVFTRSAAVKAVQEARTARAGDWAYDLLRDAEITLDGALLEYRRQETRFISLRNFGEARIRLRLAREKAETARNVAVRLEDDARTDAETVVGEAVAALAGAEDLAHSVRMDRQSRRHLQEARSQVAQARVFFQSGDFLRARDLARDGAENAAESVEGAVRLASRYVDAAHVQQWRNWVEETVQWSRRTGGVALVVNKEKRLLTLYHGGNAVKTYRADIGRNSLHNKLRAGDDATPEGRYRIVTKKGRGSSRYYKALLLDYPTSEDRKRIEAAKRNGEVAAGARPGGLIEVHGEGGRGENWTNGCVALSNDDMDEVFARVAEGTPVTIVGGVGEGGVYSNIVKNMASAANGTGL